MKVKAILSLVAAMAVAVGMSTHAQSTTPAPEQQSSAGANTFYDGTTGTSANGASVYGGGGATANAHDPAKATTVATATGAGAGNAHASANKAKSDAIAATTGTATASGKQRADVNIGLSAGQSNNAMPTGGNTYNFASAGNQTDGLSQGSASGTDSVTGTGVAGAKGNSYAKLKGAGSNNAASAAGTEGSSQGTTSFSGKTRGTPVYSSGVNGQGGINTQSVAGDPLKSNSTYAGGTALGTALYGAQSPTAQTAKGNLRIQGKTSGTIHQTANSVNVAGSSAVQSEAKAGTKH